jgi:hypothetical protein
LGSPDQPPSPDPPPKFVRKDGKCDTSEMQGGGKPADGGTIFSLITSNPFVTGETIVIDGGYSAIT